MDLIKKLFDNKQAGNDKSDARPDNTKLIFHIDNWRQNPTRSNYKIVIDELMQGSSYLLLPTNNDGKEITAHDWQVAQSDTRLTLTSVVNLDGLKVLAVFTDKKALLKWAKKLVTYTALKSQDLLSLCEANHIDRIVINSDSKNMFVLERNRQSLKEITVKEHTPVKLGTPAKPLDKKITDKLIARFKEINTIEEAYQYLQEMNEEFSIMIGVKLSVTSENAKTAVLNAVQDAILHEKPDQFVDIFFIETEHWLNTIRNIHYSLFYKKQD